MPAAENLGRGGSLATDVVGTKEGCDATTVTTAGGPKTRALLGLAGPQIRSTARVAEFGCSSKFQEGAFVPSPPLCRTWDE